MGIVAGINAAEVAAMVVATGGYATGRAAVGYVVLNPQAVQHAGDFIGGFVPGIAPERPSWGGLAGSAARSVLDRVQSNGTCNRKCN